jgi:hypothetical protein
MDKKHACKGPCCIKENVKQLHESFTGGKAEVNMVNMKRLWTWLNLQEKMWREAKGRHQKPPGLRWKLRKQEKYVLSIWCKENKLTRRKGKSPLVPVEWARILGVEGEKKQQESREKVATGKWEPECLTDEEEYIEGWERYDWKRMWRWGR